MTTDSVLIVVIVNVIKIKIKTKHLTYDKSIFITSIFSDIYFIHKILTNNSYLFWTLIQFYKFNK